MEFHISRAARRRYQFDEALFATNGNVIFANFPAARRFALKMSQKRSADQAVRAGQINAMGLIDEILHFVVALYQRQAAPSAMSQALSWLEGRLGAEKLNAVLRTFCEEFPPLAVYRGEISIDAYLAGGTRIPNRQIVLEEILLLWLANANPAFAPFRELFDDHSLAEQTSYPQLIAGLHEFFAAQPFFGPENQNLVDMLRSPAIAVPHSLSGQLEYIRSRWGYLLGDLLRRLLSSLDMIKEEEKLAFSGPGPSRPYDYHGMEGEAERFSPDLDWMPNLVLLAKNTYVWLYQLSQKYGQPIHHLEQIPDAELEMLARRGFSGLWLIGLWERSPASKRFKQMLGNPEAAASAYSLYDYQIAQDLGGEDGFQDLRQRAWRQGIRLASDMVPNHMGIDSRWVIEHPDWFISLPDSPFPSYTFNGQDLSWDARTGLYIEDHYYNHSDAAVVFKRLDRWTGDVRYIYHGNDGTSMPWNDTAQLNYLMPEVREAVIQTILSVARKFPVIRFDAAMTLAKKHYQRLWFPEPGSGGDIPSRAGLGLTRPQFDAVFPQEFWREVVDRVAKEAPDTLLLAEAFWLMEGYFVRTLGMHRVYNSAFMNMLRDEKNQEYRLVIKNTLEFDAQILRRFVNFMNNPDERTAVDQFGKGDKYFGICTLMATLPGLPMFGHGQVEGFTEKYGMEYMRAYQDEQADEALVQRHEREIFPLLRRRRQFAGVENFLLYDFYVPEGYVNEDVFAYSNHMGDTYSLVLYHNKFADTRGYIRLSSATPLRTASGQVHMTQKGLGEALGLPGEGNAYVRFRDHATGLEYLRNCQDLHRNGMYAELGAYKYHVFLDFQVIYEDEEGTFGRLNNTLNGRGVPSLDNALNGLRLEPVRAQFYRLLQESSVEGPIAAGSLEQFLRELRLYIQRSRPDQPVDEILNLAKVTGEIVELDNAVQRVLHPQQSTKRKASKNVMAARDYLAGGSLPRYQGALTGVLLRTWCVLLPLSKPVISSIASDLGARWVGEWQLAPALASYLIEQQAGEALAWQATDLLNILLQHPTWMLEAKPEGALRQWLADPLTARFIEMNIYNGQTWFSKEGFETLVWWLFFCGAVALSADGEPGTIKLVNLYRRVQLILAREAASGYQVEKLLAA